MNKYTLIITEKPDAAMRIALALDKNENPKRLSENGVPYYVAKRQKEILIVPSLGHLYTIIGAQKGRNYPAFDYKWAPRYVAERKTARIRTWIQTIARLARNADAFIDACDYDIEGCIIGYCILKYACGNMDRIAKRMKYSTLTRQDLKKAYSKLLPHLDSGLIQAGCARHEIDWLYGINLSRALTSAAKKWSGRYTTISTGRVQGPTLKFVVAREEAIKTFVPRPYWEIKAEVEIDGRIFVAKCAAGKISNKSDAESIVSACRDKNGRIDEVEVRQFKQAPPFPFNLGTLQNEAYSVFEYTPQRVLNIAQQLYLKALISYPRTDSQKLPPAIGYRKILKNLSKKEQFKTVASELLAKEILKPNEGKKDDSAHPAIYPTGDLPESTLSTCEKRLWDLIVLRFMSVFGEPATKQITKVSISVDGHHLHVYGRRILKEGWIHQYPPYAVFEDTSLPSMEKGQLVKIRKVILENLFTNPPSRYNQSSLLGEMEKAGIGTKATRADTIQTLYDRGYVRGDRMVATEMGFEVCQLLERYCPAVISIALTRELEAKMNGIQEQREKREEVLAEAITILKPVLQRLKEDEKTIGEQLSEAIRTAKFEKQVIGLCPVCRTGKLIVTRSKKTRKRFIGCTNYFKGMCNTSFPLPQRGTLGLHHKKCRICGWPTIVLRARKHPWILCFNPGCASRKEREKK